MREDHIFYLGLLAIVLVLFATFFPNESIVIEKECTENCEVSETPYAIKNIAFKNFGIPLILIAGIIVGMTYSIRKKHR